MPSVFEEIRQQVAWVALGVMFLGCTWVGMGCDGSASSTPTEPEMLRSQAQRVVTPTLSAEEKDGVVAANTEFAARLYQEVAEPGENMFFSPLSISLALTMTYAGAEHETAEQMLHALQLTDHAPYVHKAFNAIESGLHTLAKPVQNEKSEPFELTLHNALWAQENVTIQNAFLDTLAENYGTGLYILDFIQHAEESRQTINRWVEHQTNERIVDLLPEQSIDHLTRFVLTNAIYFKASWLTHFDQDATQKADFHKGDGSTRTVDMMHQTLKSTRARADEDLKVVELPYDGGDISMFVFLPEDFSAFERELSEELLHQAIDSLTHYGVSLWLPRFEIKQDIDLKKSLRHLGMNKPFEAGAQFGGISDEIPLRITDVFHQAFIAVDEKGTEAAAATAVIVGTESAGPQEHLDFRADKPFFFVIQDNDSHNILFMGRVVDP